MSEKETELKLLRRAVKMLIHDAFGRDRRGGGCTNVEFCCPELKEILAVFETDEQGSGRMMEVTQTKLVAVKPHDRNLPPRSRFVAQFAVLNQNNGPISWSLTDQCKTAEAAYADAAKPFGNYYPIVDTVRVYELERNDAALDAAGKETNEVRGT